MSTAASAAHLGIAMPIGKPVMKYSGSTTNFVSGPAEVRLPGTVTARRSRQRFIMAAADARSGHSLTGWQVICIGTAR